jgi:hypothetical protein
MNKSALDRVTAINGPDFENIYLCLPNSKTSLKPKSSQGPICLQFFPDILQKIYLVLKD